MATDTATLEHIIQIATHRMTESGLPAATAIIAEQLPERYCAGSPQFISGIPCYGPKPCFGAGHVLQIILVLADGFLTLLAPAAASYLISFNIDIRHSTALW